ncbi:MAG: MCE family protein [Candidatus Hydrogenedentota bacterium]|nr:MAG: MCE family protein [Candidatus Hydrogenedentota bacterium]
MGKRANPTVIGAFVLGAVVLVVIGIVVFGSGRFFKEKTKWVLFFEDPLGGLAVGSPVNFKGVQVGSVTDIQVHYNPEDLSMLLPVYIEVEPDRTVNIARTDEPPVRSFEEFIERGLRAQLKTQSLLTGQLGIELDFHPDKPVRLVDVETEYPQIPTIPTTITEITKKLEDLPFEELIDSALDMIESIDRLVDSVELAGAISSFEQVMKDADRLVKNVDTHVEPLATSLDETIRDTQRLVRNIDGEVQPIATSVEETLEDARMALQRAEQALSNIEGATAEESTISYELTRALREASAAARSLRLMTDYIERHPESLLRGKRGPTGD